MKDLTFSRAILSPFAGVRTIESGAATALPDGKPTTDDMRDMVEHFHALGLIKRKPAAFQIGDTLVIHPTLLRAVQKRLSDDLNKMTERAFFGAVRGKP